MNIKRRDFLKLGLGAFVTPFVLSGNGLATNARAAEQWFAIDANRDAAEVFGISVASGDPSATGVVLWTRVNSEAWAENQKLAFQVATDENFANVVCAGLADARDFSPARDCTVKIDLDGRLESNRAYFYRFIYDRTTSRAGRCRTLPAANQSISSVKFGVLTCQDYTNGYYGALARVADDDSIDFVIHLGDFIYETAGDPRFQSLPYADRTMILPSGGIVALGLEDFRFIYRRYRSDANLQRAMERHTFIQIWDDHECCNDAYWDAERDCLGAPDHPFTLDAQYGNDPARLNQLKFDSQRAWTEYVPARVTLNEDAEHPHDFLSIYRKFQFGNLVELFMTDERTYRSAHPCGEDSPAVPGGYGARYVHPGCPAQTDAARTMLGTNQRDWLTNGVKNSRSLWKVWGNQVFTAPMKIGATFFNLDAWDGYEAERKTIMRRFAENYVKNLVVLTGDLHTYMASYLKIDYALPQNSDTVLPGNIGLPNPNVRNLVGVEFMTSGLTSANLKEILQGQIPPEALSEATVKINNPHIDFFNSEKWGYSTVEFTRSHCVYTAYDVDKAVNSGSAPTRVLKRLRVPVNQIKIEPA